MLAQETTGPQLSVVVPCYGSEKYLGATVGELHRSLSGRISFEIVLVNDGSPDRVDVTIAELSERHPEVRGINLGGNIGQHGATLRGFRASLGSIVVTVDDDGQNPPEAVWAVTEALRSSGLDVIYGTRDRQAHRAHRNLASGLNRWMSRHLIGNRDNIPISNVRAIRGELARAIGSAPAAFPFIDAMLFRATNRIGQTSVPHKERKQGDSTYTLGRLFRLWLSHLTTLSVLPLRVATVGSFSVSTLGFAIGLQRTALALSAQQAPAGWLSLFVALTLLFSLLFGFLGVLGIYVGRLYVANNLGGLVWERAFPPSTRTPDQPREVP